MNGKDRGDFNKPTFPRQSVTDTEVFDEESSTEEGESFIARTLFGNAASLSRKEKHIGASNIDNDSATRKTRFNPGEKYPTTPLTSKRSSLGHEDSLGEVPKWDISSLSPETQNIINSLQNSSSSLSSSNSDNSTKNYRGRQVTTTRAEVEDILKEARDAAFARAQEKTTDLSEGRTIPNSPLLANETTNNINIFSNPFLDSDNSEESSDELTKSDSEYQNIRINMADENSANSSSSNISKLNNVDQISISRSSSFSTSDCTEDENFPKSKGNSKPPSQQRLPKPQSEKIATSPLLSRFSASRIANLIGFHHPSQNPKATGQPDENEPNQDVNEPTVTATASSLPFTISSEPTRMLSESVQPIYDFDEKVPNQDANEASSTASQNFFEFASEPVQITSNSPITDSKPNFVVAAEESMTSFSTNEHSVDEADESNIGNEDDSILSASSSQDPSFSKPIAGITVDTNLARASRKEPRFVVRSPTSPRSTRKRTFLRRPHARILPTHSSPSQSSITTKYLSESSEDNPPDTKSKVKTLEISSELEEINAQFEETLNEFSKRYQDSTVALAEKSHFMKRNQGLLHTLAAKEEEIDYLKNELWSAGNKLQEYESDLKQLVEQNLDPLALTYDDLTQIEREMENHEVLIRGYQAENDTLCRQTKVTKEQLEQAVKEGETQTAKINELMAEIEQLRSMAFEKNNNDYVSEAVLQQMDEMKEEIKRLKIKEATLVEKEVALKQTEEMKKELSELKDRESNYMIKIDDLENQISEARVENEQATRTNTKAMERLTEEMNIMKYTYESQIENLQKELSIKDGRDTRFRRLQKIIEQSEDAAGRNSEVFQLCAELRKSKLLPPRKRRKSIADGSKDPWNNRDASSSASSTRKNLKRSPSQSSFGSRSRASTISGRASPTSSVLSSMSGVSTRDEFLDTDIDMEVEIDHPEITELKQKMKKLQEEKNESEESKQNLEDDIKLLQEVNERLEEQIRSLKRELAEKKEEYDKKIRDMEEIVLELSTDPTPSSAEANLDSSGSNELGESQNPSVIPTHVQKELDEQKGMIEELVEKLKRKEENLEYYQNAYLEKAEELEKHIERAQTAGPLQNSDGGGSNAIKYLSQTVPKNQDITNLESLPITSDLLAGFFEGLGNNGEFNDIERLIAQLERTIVEKTMQLEAAHQRASDAEAKLLVVTREKISWGSGSDNQLKGLKRQVQQLQELLQIERKELRKAKTAAAIAKQSLPKSNIDQNFSLENSQQNLANDQKDSLNLKSTPSKTFTAIEVRNLRKQIDVLTTENIYLKAQLETSESIRKAIHEKTLTILQQNDETSLAAVEDLASMRNLAMNKEAELGVLKGRCAGLEHVAERQRAVLALMGSSLSSNALNLPNNPFSHETSDIQKLLDDDGIDTQAFESLSETANQIIQHLRQENILLRQVVASRHIEEEEKVGTNLDDATQLHLKSSDSSLSTKLETLVGQISTIEQRFEKREKELGDVIAETKRQANLNLEKFQAKWGTIIDKKNAEIKSIRRELEAVSSCLGKLEDGKENRRVRTSLYNGR